MVDDISFGQSRTSTPSPTSSTFFSSMRLYL
jgi:hypothetical protein